MRTDLSVSDNVAPIASPQGSDNNSTNAARYQEIRNKLHTRIRHTTLEIVVLEFRGQNSIFYPYSHYAKSLCSGLRTILLN